MKYLIILILFVSCTKPEMVKVGYTPIVVEYNGFDKSMLIEINQLRYEHNLNALIPEKTITFGAQSHATYMAYNDTISHDYFWDRYINSQALTFGECCAYNYINAQSTMSAFEVSAPHLKVLLEDYKYCGISKVGDFTCIDLANY